MTTVLYLFLACMLGTFTGNVVLFWGIGMMVARKEKQQEIELQKLQKGYLQMAEREKERLERYAKMEG